jgi:hypothetical protein
MDMPISYIQIIKLFGEDFKYKVKGNGKAVPQHTNGGAGGGDIASTHS